MNSLLAKKDEKINNLNLELFNINKKFNELVKEKEKIKSEIFKQNEKNENLIKALILKLYSLGKTLCL